MDILKINNKYKYFEKTKKPVLKDYSSDKNFEKACQLYCWEKQCGGFLSVNSILEDFKLKTTKVRHKRIEIKVGSSVFIDRWDGNGISDKVKVVSIKAGISRAIIKTNKGYFIFSKWNRDQDNINFKWTCKGKEWQKKYMKWINGNDYFLRATY